MNNGEGQLPKVLHPHLFLNACSYNGPSEEETSQSMRQKIRQFSTFFFTVNIFRPFHFEHNHRMTVDYSPSFLTCACAPCASVPGRRGRGRAARLPRPPAGLRAGGRSAPCVPCWTEGRPQGALPLYSWSAHSAALRGRAALDNSRMDSAGFTFM